MQVQALGTEMSVAMVTPKNIPTQHNVIFLIKFDCAVWCGCKDVGLFIYLFNYSVMSRLSAAAAQECFLFHQSLT